MKKHEKELLELAKQRRQEKEPEQFKSWAKGFIQPADTSQELKQELNKLLES